MDLKQKIWTYGQCKKILEKYLGKNTPGEYQDLPDDVTEIYEQSKRNKDVYEYMQTVNDAIELDWKIRHFDELFVNSETKVRLSRKYKIALAKIEELKR